MKRNALIISIFVIIFSLLTFSCTFAAKGMDSAVNGIRNFVGGTENVIEDAGNTITSTVRNGMNTLGNGARDAGNTIENGARDVGNTVENGARDVGNTVGGIMTDNHNNNGYTATRTSADTDIIGGMNTSGWTWFIVGVTALAIGVLVWSYFRENHTRNAYIDSDDIDE